MWTHIDLFSGIGGFALAAKWAGFKTVAFIEIDEYCQEIIKARFGAVAGNGEGRRSRLFRDIRDFDGTLYRGATVLTGGFPCQPFSQAGKRRGKEDDRYLWPEMLRVISEARPAWVVGENVAGIVQMELDRVLSDLEDEGYAVQSLVIPACAVDAKHRRDRVWIVGKSDAERCDGRQNDEGQRSPNGNGLELSGEDVADATGEGSRDYSEVPTWSGITGRDSVGCGGLRQPADSEAARWEPEPDVGRVAHGIPNRVDRLKGLGNAIVPQVAYEILRAIARDEV